MLRVRRPLLWLAALCVATLTVAGCCCDPDKHCIKDPPCKPCEQPCDGYAPAPPK